MTQFAVVVVSRLVLTVFVPRSTLVGGKASRSLSHRALEICFNDCHGLTYRSSKRKGLEKALYQVEEALRRASPGFRGTDAGKAISELKAMMNAGQEPQLSGSGASNKRPRLNTTASSEHQDYSSSEEEEEDSPLPRKNTVERRPSVVSQRLVKVEERLAVEDAENPLQLLARASNLHLSPGSSHGQSPGTATSYQPASTVVEELDPELRYVENFFGTTAFNIDRAEGYDPIELGLVTEDEAETLFVL
jgi:hypothetical protein